MIPMRTSSVFKSRWMALIWAAGIIWFAYDTASSQPQGDGKYFLGLSIENGRGHYAEAAAYAVEAYRDALAAGKRVRTETGLGEGAVSVSYAAIALAVSPRASFNAPSRS